MEPDTANEFMPEVEPPRPKSFFTRLGGVYASPRETFKEIGQAPAVWVPLIVLLAISLLAGFYLSRTLDLESMMATQLETAVQQGRITQEQMDQQLLITSKLAGVQLIAGAAIGSLLMVFAIAGYGKLFTIFAGAENKFKPLLSVTIFTLLAVTIIQSALTILVLQLKGPGDVGLANINSVVASSLGALLTSVLGADALPKFLLSLANAVDVFAIWTIVLLAIGYSAVSKRLKTGTAVFWIVLAYAIIVLISAAISSLFGSSGTS